VDLDVSGKVAVVTGASKGIGMATTELLADEGALVVGGALSISSLLGLTGVTAVRVDLSDRHGPDYLINRAVDEHGGVDILINNLGAMKVRLDGFLGLTDEDFSWALEMNFFAGLRATRAALPAMLARGGGVIVNVASVHAIFQPDGFTTDYGAAKAAVVNLTASLAQEFGPQGIRVNAVSPGPVNTDLWLGPGGVAETIAAHSGIDSGRAREAIVAQMGGLATGRFSTAEEVASLVVLLASGRLGNVT
jgi:NAD(P)-dependent dehydrogenase (short-subunit alcohol dehydrogenase family)